MKKLIFLLFTFLLVINSKAQSDIYDGKVIKILDENVILIKDKSNKLNKVFLAGIKTPSTKQPYYKETHEFIAKEILNKKVRVFINSRENYKAYAWINYDEKSLYEELLTEGLAWINKKQLNNGFVDAMQDGAMREKIGVWSLDDDKNPALIIP
ncbi:thermonuclease family protein [Flavobacterium sp. KACC 22761]|uniref:thermonuclease family protein n=1 Tax=Flavobacterium sp. KACC 22761 TaxID=3092665 RepID=UPI002A74AE81|nr:thermonuclease family protein [Flavobacterium sp. KACC 22761]WPO77705.1 thermonuclease family protein [Flavobacterium sp. KACC 22761]